MLHSPSFNYTRLSLLRGSLFTAHVQHLTIQITLNSKLGRFIQCNEHVTIHLTVFQFISNQVTFTIDLPKFLTATEFITIGVTIITIHFFCLSSIPFPFSVVLEFSQFSQSSAGKTSATERLAFPALIPANFSLFPLPESFFAILQLHSCKILSAVVKLLHHIKASPHSRNEGRTLPCPSKTRTCCPCWTA